MTGNKLNIHLIHQNLSLANSKSTKLNFQSSRQDEREEKQKMKRNSMKYFLCQRALHVWPQLQSHVGRDSKNKWMNYWIAMPLQIKLRLTHSLTHTSSIPLSSVLFFVFRFCVINGLALSKLFFFFFFFLLVVFRFLVLIACASESQFCFLVVEIGCSIRGRGRLWQRSFLRIIMMNEWSAIRSKTNRVEKSVCRLYLPSVIHTLSTRQLCVRFDEREKTNARIG